MKTIGITLLVTVLVGTALLMLIIFSGAYDVAATSKHSKPVEWMFATLARNSIHSQSRAMDSAHLASDQADTIGAQHFNEMCVTCHGAPGVARSEIGEGLYPRPPDLADSAQKLDRAEIYWVIKNGIKMTGMPAFGETHSDEEIRALVAFVAKLPDLKPEQYQSIAGAASGEQHATARHDRGAQSPAEPPAHESESHQEQNVPAEDKGAPEAHAHDEAPIQPAQDSEATHEHAAEEPQPPEVAPHEEHRTPAQEAQQPEPHHEHAAEEQESKTEAHKNGETPAHEAQAPETHEHDSAEQEPHKAEAHETQAPEHDSAEQEPQKAAASEDARADKANERESNHEPGATKHEQHDPASADERPPAGGIESHEMDHGSETMQKIELPSEQRGVEVDDEAFHEHKQQDSTAVIHPEHDPSDASIEGRQIWACPTHPEVTAETPGGRCPTCDTVLVPVKAEP